MSSYAVSTFSGNGISGTLYGASVAGAPSVAIGTITSETDNNGFTTYTINLTASALPTTLDKTTNIGISSTGGSFAYKLLIDNYQVALSGAVKPQEASLTYNGNGSATFTDKYYKAYFEANSTLSSLTKGQNVSYAYNAGTISYAGFTLSGVSALEESIDTRITGSGYSSIFTLSSAVQGNDSIYTVKFTDTAISSLLGSTSGVTLSINDDNPNDNIRYTLANPGGISTIQGGFSSAGTGTGIFNYSLTHNMVHGERRHKRMGYSCYEHGVCLLRRNRRRYCLHD